MQQFERKNASLQDHYKRAVSDLNRNNEVKSFYLTIEYGIF